MNHRKKREAETETTTETETETETETTTETNIKQLQRLSAIKRLNKNLVLPRTLLLSTKPNETQAKALSFIYEKICEKKQDEVTATNFAKNYNIIGSSANHLLDFWVAKGLVHKLKRGANCLYILDDMDALNELIDIAIKIRKESENIRKEIQGEK